MSEFQIIQLSLPDPNRIRRLHVTFPLGQDAPLNRLCVREHQLPFSRADCAQAIVLIVEKVTIQALYLPWISSEISTPSITRSVGAEVPASFAKVGIRSMVAAMASDSVPAGSVPAHA